MEEVLESPHEIQETVSVLNRRVGLVNSNLTLRRRTLKGIDVKMYQYQSDLDSVKKWMVDAEAALELPEDDEKVKVSRPSIIYFVHNKMFSHPLPLRRLLLPIPLCY